MLINQPVDVGLLDHLVLNINVPLILKSSFPPLCFHLTSQAPFGGKENFWR